MIGDAVKLVLKVYAAAWALSAVPGLLPRMTLEMAKLAYEDERSWVHSPSRGRLNHMFLSGNAPSHLRGHTRSADTP